MPDDRADSGFRSAATKYLVLLVEKENVIARHIRCTPVEDLL